MKGTIEVKTKQLLEVAQRGWLCKHDYEEKNGKKEYFRFFLTPYSGENFFNVNKTSKGKYELDGELYLLYSPAQVNPRKREAEESKKKNGIEFHFFNENSRLESFIQ